MAYKKKTNRTETSPSKRATVYTHYLDGHTIAAFVRLEQLPRSTVRSIIGRTKAFGPISFKSKPRSSAPKKTTDRDNRALLRTANRDTKATLWALVTPSKSTKQLDRNTVRNILAVYSKYKSKPCKKPFLKCEYKAGRRVWCKAEKKGKRDWNKVYWSDEVIFEVGADGSIWYIIRTSGKDKEWLEKNLKPSFKSGRTSVGV